MALGVAFYHFTIWYPVFEPGRFVAYTAAKIGHYGVEGFFIISGFCFFHLYRDAPPRGAGLWRFHLKRFLRIAPLYYLAAGFSLALGLGAGPAPSPRILLENATLTFGLFHPNHSLVLGGWSIGVEYVFYLAFPVLAWAAGRWRPFLALASVAALLASLPYTLEWVPAAPMAGDAKFHTYVQVANHAFLFFLGGLVAQVRGRVAARLPRWAFLALGALLVLAFSRYLRNFYDHFTVLAGPPRYVFAGLCLGIVALFTFRDFPDSPWKRAGVFLGDVSYSVYLLHPFAHELLERILPGAGPAAGFSLGLGLTLGLAALSYRWIERPAMAWARRRTGGAPAPAP
jgi:peptidoglycan/LPS O-acetylase OafA/YrhL